MRISDWSSDVCSSDLPVILDPRISSSIIGHLLGAIAGPAIARGTSFLLGKEERMLFDSGIVIRDEPHRARGLRSRAFAGEGLPTAARHRKSVVSGKSGSLRVVLRCRMSL